LKIDVEARRGAAEMLRAARCVYFEVSGKHFGLFRYDIRTVLNLPWPLLVAQTRG
jgi:hypothetical protein